MHAYASILRHQVLEALTEKYTKVQEQAAHNLFENGVNYEIVRASIKGLTDEELQAIYEEVIKVCSKKS